MAKSEERFVQFQNPRTKLYTKYDTKKGLFVGAQKEKFKGVPIKTKKK